MYKLVLLDSKQREGRDYCFKMTAKVDTDESGEIFYSTKVFAVSRPGIKPDENARGL